MEITSETGSLFDKGADWLVVGHWQDEPLTGLLADLDVRLDSQISALLTKGDINGKAKELTPIYHTRAIEADRLLVVGLGSKEKADMASLWAAGAAAGRAISTKMHQRVVWAVPDEIPGMDADALAYGIGVGFMQGCTGPGLRKSKPDRFEPKELCLVGREHGDLRATARRVEVEGRAVNLARELVNLPPCDLYPESFAEQARHVAQRTGMECTVLDEKQLAAENMNSLLAVAQGSDRPARMVVLRYRRVREGKLLAMVGKGVTFDSGGLSLKSTEHMVDMKCDMAGGAAVLAGMQAIAELALPVNLIGIIPLVENMPSGKSVKLGDVLRARNGKTIEVLNTDAEGRLILADALAYAVDMNVDHIIDLATLTGACMVALGSDVAGVMGNRESWNQGILDAARRVGEKLWPLPMYPHYGEMIKSDIADIKNTGGSRYAGAITGAKFLEEFVGKVPWAHLDIAGPAWAEKESSVRPAGGTGCFVRTLVELARNYNNLG